MGKVSFKISTTGIKYCPSLKKKKIPSHNNHDNNSNDGERNSEAQSRPTSSVLDSSGGSKRKRPEFACSKNSDDHVPLSLLSTTSEGSSLKTEHEASFALNVFLDGFSIGKPTEQGKQPPSAQELTESLHPYSRTCKTLFQAIDNGLLPGDILEEIPCKYVNGSVVCEVRDYRKGSPISGDSVSSGEGCPVVQKVHLHPTMENIVKDIASMAEESWEYSDLMEIESRILKAVRPKLCLDSTPMLERLCEIPNASKVNLEVLITRRQRIQTVGLPKVMSNNLSHGKKVFIEGNTEKPKSQSGIAGATTVEDSRTVCSQEIFVPNSGGICSSISVNRPKFHCSVESGQDVYRLGTLVPSNSIPLQSGLNRPRLLRSQGNQSPILSPVTSVSQHSMQDWTNTLTDARNMSGAILGKRDNKELAMTGKLDLKKQKLEQSSMEKIQQQNLLPKIDTKLNRDQQRKDLPILSNQNNEALYFPDMSVQRHPQQVTMDDDQKVAVGEISVDKSKLSPLADQRSTLEFKVKEEQLDFDRGQIGIERENQEVERNKDNQLLMELDNDRSGTQQMVCQHFSQQQCGKSSFQWQSLGQIGEKDQKRDELPQRRKLLQSPRETVKVEVRSVIPSQFPSKSGDLSQPLTSSATSSISLGPLYNNIAAPVGLMQQEKSQGLASVSTSVTSVNPSHIDSQHQQAQQSISFGRRRSNSLPRTTSASGVASPGSVTNSMTPSNVNSPSTGTAPMSSSVIRPDQSVVSQGQLKQLETLSSLVLVVQRHGLHMKKKTVEEVPEPKKTQPSWDSLIFALASATNNEDQKDIKGQKSLANSLVGGDVNARKTRIMNFIRAEHIFQANSVPSLKRNEVRLVMCERAKDGMVEAVVQFGNGQEDDSTNSCPHDVLPSLCNTHFADRLAEQFRALMQKDGYELVEDKIQPIQQRQQTLSPNVSSITHAMAVGASALGSNMNQLPNSPHLMVNQNMPGSAAVCGIPSLSSLPLSSANILASSRLPPGNPPTRQIASGFMQSGLGTSSKPLQLDHVSQLAVMQQQHQLQQHPQKPLQRSQQLVNANHLAQLTAANQTSNQQMNSQIMNSASQLQIQLLQQQQRQQQQQHQQLPRKMIIPGSLSSNVGVNSMSGVGMSVSGGPQGGLNVVGLNGMSSIVGMNSPSMGAMPHLASINNSVSSVGGIGQNSNIVNMMGQHIPNITPHAAAAFSNKPRMSPVRGRPAIRNTFENNITGISASNQAQNPANMAILGQQQGRGNMSGLLNRGMGPPKLGTTGIPGVAGQNMYLNHQLNSQSSQINSQQPLNQQQQLNVQQQVNASHSPSSQQPLSSQPLSNMPNQLNQQQQISPQQLNSQSQINPHQQINTQQLSSQSQLNPQQMNVGNLGSLVGGPSSPQRSSQTLGSVSSITSSPMELQSANRGNSMTTAL